MNAGPLLRILEKNPPEMLTELNAELKINLGTSHYRRLSEEQLAQRHFAVTQGLAHWLTTRDESVLQKTGEDLGKRRFAEGIPLGQVVLALILVEKYLWIFLESYAAPMDEAIRQAVVEFFQKDAYYTAKGYQESLAVSNRLARRHMVPEPGPTVAVTPAKNEPSKDYPDMQISRGGQVGEHGG